MPTTRTRVQGALQRAHGARRRDAAAARWAQRRSSTATMLLIADDGGADRSCRRHGRRGHLDHGGRDRTCCSRWPISRPMPSPAARAALACRPMRASASSAASIRRVRPRAMERATALLLALCGGEAGRRAGSVRTSACAAGARCRCCCVARDSPLLAGADLPTQRVEAQPATRSGMSVDARPAGLDASRRLRGASTSRSRPTSSRKCCASWASTPCQRRARAPAAALRASQRIADRRARAARRADRARLSGSDQLRLRRSASCSSKLFPAAAAVTLSNPIAADLACDARVAVAGPAEGRARESSRQQDRVRLFERGACSCATAARCDEVTARRRCRRRRARHPSSGAVRATTADFFDLKADVAAVLALAGPASPSNGAAATLACLHPGPQRTVLRDGVEIGWLGELHPSLARGAATSGRRAAVRTGHNRRRLRRRCRSFRRFRASRRCDAICPITVPRGHAFKRHQNSC